MKDDAFDVELIPVRRENRGCNRGSRLFDDLLSATRYHARSRTRARSPVNTRFALVFHSSFMPLLLQRHADNEISRSYVTRADLKNHPLRGTELAAIYSPIRLSRNSLGVVA